MTRQLELIGEPPEPAGAYHRVNDQQVSDWDVAVDLLYDCARAVDAGEMPPAVLDKVRDIVDKRLSAAKAARVSD